MLLLLISVCLINHIVSPVCGLINITSHPAKVENGKFVKLVCDVGTMKDTVKWVYDGVTYFSCDPPYANCYTNANSTNDDFYEFSVAKDSLIGIFRVYSNHNDGIWSCYHGNENADFDIENGARARIHGFYVAPWRTSEDNVKCVLDENKTPVDVLIYVEGYEGKRILYDVKQSNLSRHTLYTSFLCSEIRIYCNVTNGYVKPHSMHDDLSIECPLKILEVLPNTTTSSLDNHRDSNRKLEIYYEGFPIPNRSFYKIGEDGIPEANNGVIHFRPATITRPAYFFGNVQSHYNYALTLKQNKITKILKFNFVESGDKIISPSTNSSENITMSTTVRPTLNDSDMTNTTNLAEDKPTTTTTTLPIRNEIMRTTTNRADDTDTTTPEDDINKMMFGETSESRLERKMDEIMIMVYMGVAGFVMTLLLVLILVVVFVFRFYPTKEKSADKMFGYVKD